MVLSSALQLRKCPRKIPLFWPVPRTATSQSSGLHSFYHWDHPSHPSTPWDTCVQSVCAKFLITLTLDALSISVTEKSFLPLNTSDMTDILPFWIKPVLYFFTSNQNFKPDMSLTKYLCPGPEIFVFKFSYMQELPELRCCQIPISFSTCEQSWFSWSQWDFSQGLNVIIISPSNDMKQKAMQLSRCLVKQLKEEKAILLYIF